MPSSCIDSCEAVKTAYNERLPITGLKAGVNKGSKAALPLMAAGRDAVGLALAPSGLRCHSVVTIACVALVDEVDRALRRSMLVVAPKSFGAIVWHRATERTIHR